VKGDWWELQEFKEGRSTDLLFAIREALGAGLSPNHSRTVRIRGRGRFWCAWRGL